MSERSLIDAVKASDYGRVTALLDRGADVHSRGEQDWPALNFAAGKGDRQMVRLLVERGADVFATGADGRTPYKIAMAASHVDVARDLKQREKEVGGDRQRVSSREWELRPYCKAYRVGDVRRYPRWPERPAPPLTDEDVVFIHENYNATRSLWRDRDVLVTGDSAEWRAFCETTLGFRVPPEVEAPAHE